MGMDGEDPPLMKVRKNNHYPERSAEMEKIDFRRLASNESKMVIKYYSKWFIKLIIPSKETRYS